MLYEEGGVRYGLIHKQKTSLGWSSGIKVNLDSQNPYDGSGALAVNATHGLAVWVAPQDGKAEIFANYGDFSKDTISPVVVVTSPIKGDQLSIGQAHVITWNSQDDVGVKTAALDYTLDDGATFLPITGPIPDSGSFTWNAPSAAGLARVRVTSTDATGNSGQTLSEAFTIGDFTAPTLNLTSPIGGEIWVAGSQQTITYTASDNTAVSSVDLLSSDDNGTSWQSIASNQPVSGAYPWVVPSAPSTTYLVKIVGRDPSGNRGEDTSPDPFTVRLANRAPHIPSNPLPGDGETGIAILTELTWNGDDPDPGDRVSYHINLGVTTTPEKVSSGQSTTAFSPDALDFGTKHYWTVTITDGELSTTGPLWSFTTLVDQVSIVTGPIGTPAIVEPKSAVSMSLTTRDSAGHTLYQDWTADCASLASSGHFEHPSITDTVWIAPENDSGKDQQCNISVKVTDAIGNSATGVHVATVRQSVPPPAACIYDANTNGQSK